MIASTQLPGRASLSGVGMMLIGLAGATSCASLESSPWESAARQGTTAVSVSSGWPVAQIEIAAEGQGGALPGVSDEISPDLAPVYGIALGAAHYVTDSLALGLRVDARSYDPDAEEIFGAAADGDDIKTTHFAATSLWLFNPIERAPWLRPFVGVEVAYIPTVDIDVDLEYAPGLGERVAVRGDEAFTLGLRAGGSMLVSDHLTLELGVLYERTIEKSRDTVTLNVPVPGVGVIPTDTDVELAPEGLTFVFGLSYYF